MTWCAGARLSCCAVRIHLDEPLLGAPDVRHLVALCATADTLIERVTRLKNVESFDVQLLQEIEATCQDLFPNKKPQVRHASLHALSTCWTAMEGRDSMHRADWDMMTAVRMLAGAASCLGLIRHGTMYSQETLQMLGLLDMFPYLTQGLVVGKLELVQDHPGARMHVALLSC